MSGITILSPGAGVRARLVALTAVVVLLALGVTAANAGAAGAPGWMIHSFATPSSFSRSDSSLCVADLSVKRPPCDGYQVTVRNAGSKAADGSNVTITDTVPAGLTVQRVIFRWTGLPIALCTEGGNSCGPEADLGQLGLCSTTPSPTTTLVQCHIATSELGLPAIAPDETLEMLVNVTVNEPAPAGPVRNAVSVSGGGAPGVSSSASNDIEAVSLSFGGSLFSDITGLDGTPETQAGAHPYELRTRIDLNNQFRISPDGGSITDTSARDDVKDVVVDLPLGFLGSALATPQCTFAQLSSHIEGGVAGCPADTVVGHIRTEPDGNDSVDGPIYNMVPERGAPAEFAYVDALAGPHVIYARIAPTPAGYVLRAAGLEAPQITLTDIVVTFFGNPSAKNPSGNAPAAMFTNPSDCSGQPLLTTMHMDSWQHPGRTSADGQPDLTDPNWVTSSSQSPPVTGCNALSFEASMGAQPETTVADSPTGFTFDLKVPQSENPSTLATPPLRNASVTLPQGLTVDPSSANGLQACSLQQIGFIAYNTTTETNEFTAGKPSCPEASKIGTVEVTTPLLANPLSGSVYLAAQNENPFHTLLAGYIVIDDPATGVVVKIPGNLTPNPSTGQITGVFDNNPQFPFTELKLHFKGGSRGALATPESCGTFSTTSTFTPWSAPDSGPPATPSDSFSINSGCVSGFSPTFTAGVTNTQAGAFSPFVLSFSRNDTDQDFSGLTATLPPGLLAKVAGVARCSDSDANTGSCPEASQIGTVLTASGPGPNPLFLPGKIYLTGPYKGAPYGESVVVPAIAGPFNLGNVVVRGAITIDPSTAQATTTSDPFPTIIDGIPIRLRRVDVTLDRAGFTFNPTSCEPMAITGTLTSTGGLSTPLSSRFQASGCSSLPFKPQFSVSTQGHTSKDNGASLTVTVAANPGEANIHKVTVQLPSALPSRLTTLQKACTNAQFIANPAGCPAASNVGTATALTPVLNVPLTGPAYLVSHGGAAFPDLEFVLQGEGVTIILDGKTNIKKGITSSKFETVPDAPITTFQTILPEGPHSVLGANANLCAPTTTITTKQHITRRVHGQLTHTTRSIKRLIPAPLLMPTTITGQNGATLQQNTKITVTGCTKTHTTKAKTHKTTSHKHH